MKIKKTDNWIESLDKDFSNLTLSELQDAITKTPEVKESHFALMMGPSLENHSEAQKEYSTFLESEKFKEWRSKEDIQESYLNFTYGRNAWMSHSKNTGDCKSYSSSSFIDILAYVYQWDIYVWSKDTISRSLVVESFSSAGGSNAEEKHLFFSVGAGALGHYQTLREYDLKKIFHEKKKKCEIENSSKWSKKTENFFIEKYYR